MAEVLLGPLNIEDEVVVSKAGHPSNCAGGILPPVEADEGKALEEGGGVRGPQGTIRTGDPVPNPHGHQPTLDWPVVLSFAK